jgi:hypothetical protein
MHRVRLLEKVIPVFATVRGLMQFNQYHKYTVDAHCIETVHQATQFLERDDTLGVVYRGLKNKWILHLALLIHDLGKGFAEDHSEVGARYAEELADRLGLSTRDKETLRYLVHQHLTMSHLSQRRDLADPLSAAHADVRRPDRKAARGADEVHAQEALAVGRGRAGVHDLKEVDAVEGRAGIARPLVAELRPAPVLAAQVDEPGAHGDSRNTLATRCSCVRRRT